MKLLKLVLLVVVAGGGYWFLTHYRIQGFENLSVQPRPPQGAEKVAANGANSPAPLQRTTLRVASVNLRPLDQNKLGRPMWWAVWWKSCAVLTSWPSKAFWLATKVLWFAWWN